jgi:hypothetical protein
MTLCVAPTCKWWKRVDKTGARRVRDKRRAGWSFHMPNPCWREEVACHVSKRGNCVGSDERH